MPTHFAGILLYISDLILFRAYIKPTQSLHNTYIKMVKNRTFEGLYGREQESDGVHSTFIFNGNFKILERI